MNTTYREAVGDWNTIHAGRRDDRQAEAFYLSFPVLVLVSYWRWI